MTLKVRGNLARGKKIDLGWADDSSVACFPATRNEMFTGNHVFFAFSLPAHSTVEIRAVPAGRDVDVSLYAYSIGSTDFSRLPPNVTSVVSCEASYEPMGRANPGATEKVTLNAVNNPYNVVVAVAGAKGAVKGKFRLEVDLTTKPAATGSTKPPPVKDFASERGKKVTVKGRLEDGHPIVLEWAESSQVACFPATKFQHFDGAHALFRTDLPKYTTMKVTLTPDDPKLDVSLYGYTISQGDTTRVAPNVTTCVSCEASYPLSGTNPGKPESIQLVAINNPYTAVLGVVGANGATRGSFTLEVELVPR
ncbi:MAG: hypothetical protein D6705_15485 [Deltaproteobacteria bacterium]|nr:MAG: hypothetical protein D6705_15485 [Deltaproteobacteria bacterium]